MEKLNSKNMNWFENIKSNYILKKIFNNLTIVRSLAIIKINKKIQKKLDITIEHYKDNSLIEIEIIPCRKRMPPAGRTERSVLGATTVANAWNQIQSRIHST